MKHQRNESDIVLQDEGEFFKIIVNTELGRIFVGEHDTVAKRDKAAFLTEARERDLTVTIVKHE